MNILTIHEMYPMLFYLILGYQMFYQIASKILISLIKNLKYTFHLKYTVHSQVFQIPNSNKTMYRSLFIRENMKTINGGHNV